MKPIRNTNWDMSYAEANEGLNKALQEVGFKEMNWEAKEQLRNTMSEDDWRAFTLEQSVLYNEARELWQERLDVIKANGQVETNIRNNELDAFCMVFQKADRILTGLANCEVHATEERTPIPAWSDGKSVTFNVSAVKQIDDSTLTSLHGLNYHEVSHLLYTPRVGSDLGGWVKEKADNGDKRIQYSFNLLEDFRAENYLVTKYPSVTPFLTAVVAEYAMEKDFTDTDLDSVFILLAGRAYMPDNLVRITAEVYAKAHGLDETKRLYTLSNEYRNLVFPRDYNRAKEIISLIAEYLPKLPELPSGCGDRQVLRNGRGSTATEQEKLSQASSADSLSPEALQELFDQIMSGKLADEAGEQGQGHSQGQGQGKSEGAGDSDSTAKTDGVSESIRNALEKAVEEAINNKVVRDKVADTKRAIKKNSGSKTFLPRQARTLAEPSLADVTAQRSFAQELERLRIDCDPDWDREKPTGKLNVQRAMQADVNDINKLFDRWSTGNDDYDIEACILLDRSGSMWHDMDNASKASWIIKRSLEKINASVSVLTFNDESRILYSSDEKAQSTYPTVLSSGGTNPEYALKEAERIMQGSTKKTKLLFLLTDGQFYGGASDESIARLKEQGVHTNLVFLGEGNWVKWATDNADKISHGVHNFRMITKPLDLVKVASDVVKHHLLHA